MEIERHDVDLVIRVDSKGTPWRRQDAASTSIPGTISADSKSTLETIAHAVRESSDAIMRSTSVSAGLAGTLTTVSSFLGEAIDLPSNAVKLAVGGNDARPCPQGQRRQPSRDQFVGVLSERDVVGAVADEPREAGANGRGLHRRSLPLVVNELGRVEPGALLRLEADIGPRLVRVAGKQQTFADPESRVVLRKGIRCQGSVVSPVLRSPVLASPRHPAGGLMRGRLLSPIPGS